MQGTVCFVWIQSVLFLCSCYNQSLLTQSLQFKFLNGVQINPSPLKTQLTISLTTGQSGVPLTEVTIANSNHGYSCYMEISLITGFHFRAWVIKHDLTFFTCSRRPAAGESLRVPDRGGGVKMYLYPAAELLIEQISLPVCQLFSISDFSWMGWQQFILSSLVSLSLEKFIHKVEPSVYDEAP